MRKLLQRRRLRCNLIECRSKLPTYLPTIGGNSPPKEIESVPDKDRFAFPGLDGRNGLFLVRKEKPGGGKYYQTYSLWSDGKWRLAEPDEQLPLWGLDQLKNRVVAFIHEGAKAARFCADVASGKIKPGDASLKRWPWLEAIQGYAHLGWIGGALRPERTDWGLLKKAGVLLVVVVADNDHAGRKAVPAIAKATGLPCVMLAFTDQFPRGYDLADPAPKEMFTTRADGTEYYIGPTLNDMKQPATWATRTVPKPKGKGVIVSLRPEFVEEWRYVAVIERFVNIRDPKTLWTAQQVNANTAPFADTCDVARLLLKEAVQKIDVTTYHPPTTERVISVEGTTAFNLFRPSKITPAKGDATPFLDFAAYLIPDEQERRHFLRWAATLIAKPETRMGFALLLCSEMQGTGKSTFGNAILEPLVGEHNVSRPTASDLQKSSFNGWMKERRLAIIEEIYEGYSWTVYNKLKSYVTEKKLRVNEKYIAETDQPNWIHFYVTSNQLMALKIDRGDRRWFIPRVTESLWPAHKFVALRAWLDTGGLAIVAYWAAGFGDYVRPGEHAPLTERKREVIALSRDPKEQEALRIAEELNAKPSPAAMARKTIDREIADALRNDKRYSDASPQMVRKALEEGGLRMWDRPMKVNGEKTDVFLSSHPEWEAIFADPNCDPLQAVWQRLIM